MVVREIEVYKDYFLDVYCKLDSKAQRKVEFVFDLIRYEKRIPGKYFKYLVNTDGIYEIRVITTFKSLRILCFFYKTNEIIILNCFVKKSRKTPPKEIKIAEKLKKEFINNNHEKN